jgi:hypothetical protein
MKKRVVLTILGMAAAATTAFGQGGIVFNNGPAGGPYNPILWGAGGPVGEGVRSSQSVNVQIWFGEGAGLTPAELTNFVPLTWNTGYEGIGFYGYYDTTVTLPQWSPGETYTFQLRASGDTTFGTIDPVSSRSVLWQEMANIGNIGGNPPGLPGNSQNRIGFTVIIPEPSTFALAGLGALALLFRRRS